MADNYETLRSKSIEQLKKEYDHIAKSSAVGLNFYREEIARREAEQQNERMLQLTETMKTLTIFVLILSAFSVFVAIGSMWVTILTQTAS